MQYLCCFCGAGIFVLYGEDAFASLNRITDFQHE